MSFGSALAKASSKISSALSSKPGKIAVTGAAIGGGTYAALTGVSAGVSQGIERVGEATGFNKVTEAVTGNSGSTKGLGTLIGILVLLGIVYFAVKIVVPVFKKPSNGGSSA